jgi:hypothetical protein
MRDLPLDPTQEMLRAVTRRHFFRQAGFGIGGAALTSESGSADPAFGSAALLQEDGDL